MRSHIVSFGVVASGVLAASGFMAAQAGVTVPSAVLAAAEASPVEFVMALANASVPAGLEIRESEDVLPASWPTVNGRRPAWFNADRTNRIAATEVVTAFNGSRRDYRAVLTGQVLVIRPIGGTLPFLDQPSAISGPTHVTGAMAAARRVFADLVPGLSGPVLNSLGHKGDDVPVVLDGGSRKVIDTLNQIVLQAPPRTWVVTTRRQAEDVRVSSFGFIEADGSRRIQRVKTVGGAISQVP